MNKTNTTKFKIDSSILLPFLGLLVSFWINLLNTMTTNYSENPANNQQFGLSIIHYLISIFIIILGMIIFETVTGKQYINSKIYVNKTVITIISLCSLLFLFCSKINIQNNFIYITTTVIFSVTLFFCMIFIISNDTNHIKTFNLIIKTVVILIGYILFLIIISLFCNNILVDSKIHDTTIEISIEEKGYFFRNSIDQVIINDYQKIDIDNATTKNKLEVTLKNQQILSEKGNFITIIYSCGGLPFKFQKDVFIQNEKKISI